jgi:ATP-dependent DNA ligase
MDPSATKPLRPMLGKLVRELPREGYLYEPKWDGFRCLVARAGGEVELLSRHGRPLARYFPELTRAIEELPGGDVILDGEIVLVRDGAFDFPALMSRLHPAASRAELLAREQPARLIAFDLLALEGEPFSDRPFRERREALESVVATGEGRVCATPITGDPDEAERWLRRYPGAGVDGVMAKDPDAPYRPGARAMLKVKLEQTADCVVAGYRLRSDRPELGSLLLGLFDEGGVLQHVGVAGAFSRRAGEQLIAELRELERPLQGHPWEHGFLLAGGPQGRLPGAAGRWAPGEMPLDWFPLEPSRVCEVRYEQLDHLRFRHPARFARWRPDREPASCALDQLLPAGAAQVSGRS